MKGFLSAVFLLGALVCAGLAYVTVTKTEAFDPEELIRNEEAAVFTGGFFLCLIIGLILRFVGRKKQDE